ncbi:hypothetical protein LTR22_008970 [Elasticomyces elasticus]|nr:hypothetical protein LTR22_008970 [Elasticomyces elasticus]KAK4922971.1 hypothetical protein LTR49_009802 [Elasticomyces elasticus]KAK5747709.1 hypothetical protein LTS12_022258 [Elasticomyces elasticus]
MKPPFAASEQPISQKHIDATGAELSKERELLRQSLQSTALDKIHKQLWYAGRIGNISPLHHQRVLRREVILTEYPRLHLVWSKRVIYVQRLPDELLSWTCYSTLVCGSQELHLAASGFLLSYTRLIEYPSDLDIAKASGLISKQVKWRAWQKFRYALIHNLTNRNIHDRFEYGELRLSRLDTIFRLRLLGLSYFSPHREYTDYFEHHYAALFALFALVSVALSAMQVISGIDGVPEAVTTTAYRFSVAALVGLASSCAILLCVYLGLYLWNWFLICFRRRVRSRETTV